MRQQLAAAEETMAALVVRLLNHEEGGWTIDKETYETTYINYPWLITARIGCIEIAYNDRQQDFICQVGMLHHTFGQLLKVLENIETKQLSPDHGNKNK